MPCSFFDGHGQAARFRCPVAIAVDDEDNIYVADCYNQRIRMMFAHSKHVLTLVGADDAGTVDGDVLTARMKYPSKLFVDRFGRLTVRDASACALRIIRTDLPWSFARVLFIGLLKAQVTTQTHPTPLLFFGNLLPYPTTT